MNPADTRVVLYMRVDPFSILTDSQVTELAELLLGILRMFDSFNQAATYG